MVNEHFFLKLPVNFKSLCNVYPPSVNDVITNPQFNMFYSLLTISQEEIEDLYIEKNIEDKMITPLEYILALSYQDKSFLKTALDGFEFFIHEKVHFLFEQKMIVIGDLEKILPTIKSLDELKIINENNYFDFQNLVRGAMGGNPIERPNPNEDARVKKIKAKARYRDRIKAQKGMGLKLNSTLASICCMGYGLNPLNIGEISYASIPALIRYYQEKDKYETDIKSLLAGADKKKVRPKNWVRNIDD